MASRTRRRAAVNMLSLIFGVVFLLGLLLTAQTPKNLPAGAKPGGPPVQKRTRTNVLEGTEAGDTLNAAEGDSWLFGRAGDDVLRGGPGSDALDGGAGDDRLAGGPGDDVLDGGAGIDALRGEEGNDTMDGGDDEDRLDGGPGDDDLDGGDADDILRGGAGDDAVVGGDGNDVLAGGAGADRLFGRDGADTLSGGPGDDVVEGGDGNDLLNGEGGNDALNGGDGADVARGAAGDDVLKGQSGSDVLSGGPGNDTLLGSRGDDFLDGGDEHDTLLGGDGQDVLSGGPGDDWLLGGLGADTVRGGAEDDLIVLRAGDVGSGENEFIDGGADHDILILNGFTHSVLPARSAPGPGDNFLSDPVTGGTYRLAGIEQVQHTHLFTQLGTGEDRGASFVFVNPSTTAVSAGRLAFFDADGAALSLSIAGDAAQPHFAFTAPPLGRVAFDASAPEQSVQGATQLLADRPLSGIVRTSPADLGPAGVGEASLLGNFIVPVLEDPATGLSTGVVIISSTVASRIKLTLHKPNGEEVTTQSQGGVEIDMPPHGRRVVFVRDIFRGLLANAGDFQGTMTVEGGIDRPQDGGSLAAIGIQQGAGSGEFATFPVIPVGPLPATRTLHFATFPTGGDYLSSIVLVNPSPTDRAKGTVAFFDEIGQNWPVAVNGLSPAVTTSYDIGPLGSVVFTTSAGGPLRVGSARAQSAEGVAGAVLRLASPTEGTVNTGPSGVFKGFIAAVQRNRATGLNTQVALRSTQSALSLALALRDAGGVEVREGSAQLQLPANGRTSRTLDELFPNADIDNFQGTLTVTAEGGTVAADVMQVGGASGGRTVMPVAPLQP